MSASIRVARVDELPPGKGKVVQVGGHVVTVFNEEGRFRAERSPRRHLGGPNGEAHAACSHAGMAFDVGAEDSPALQANDPPLTCSLDGDYVVLDVGEPLPG